MDPLTARFPWGVLLITDDDSTEEIPPWKSEQEPVTASDTALVVRVIHEQEGVAAVSILRDVHDAAGMRVFHGTLNVPSGLLRIGDALGKVAKRINLGEGQHPVDVFVDQSHEASKVDIVLPSWVDDPSL